MQLNVVAIDPEAKLPTRAHKTDAGLDLYSVEGFALNPGERRVARTGIALAIPDGYVGLIWDKSGVAANGGIKTMGGVVDSAYRGEVGVIMMNLSSSPYRVEKGDKVAQILIQKVETVDVCEVSGLDDTMRGADGFGSTGLK